MLGVKARRFAGDRCLGPILVMLLPRLPIRPCFLEAQDAAPGLAVGGQPFIVGSRLGKLSVMCLAPRVGLDQHGSPSAAPPLAQASITHRRLVAFERACAAKARRKATSTCWRVRGRASEGGALPFLSFQ